MSDSKQTDLGSRKADDLTDSDLDAADARDLHNLRLFRDEAGLPGHIREAIEGRIAQLEHRERQRYLRRLQGGADDGQR